MAKHEQRERDGKIDLPIMDPEPRGPHRVAKVLRVPTCLVFGVEQVV